MKKIALGLAVTFFMGAGLWWFRFRPPGLNFRPVVSVPGSTDAALPNYTDLCSGGQASNYSCYESVLARFTRDRGVKEAFKALRALYPIRPTVSAGCHPLTHVIGRTAAEKYSNISAAFLDGDTFCWSGYYHGVMEGVVKIIGRANLEAKMDNICAEIPGKSSYSFNYYNCVHGLGHGVMETTDDDLFAALGLCDGLTGQWERQSCYGGVFMENIIVDASGESTGHSTKFLKPADPLYPCNSISYQYRGQCYQMQTSYMKKLFQADFRKIFAECSLVEADFRSTCYQSLGRDASGFTVSDPVATKRICDLGPDEIARRNCLLGAVRDFISYYHSDTAAKKLCDLAPESDKVNCSRVVSSYYQSF